MADPTSCVVENFGWRKRLVTTFVCQNPKTSCEQSLDDTIDEPKRSSDWSIWDIFWGKESVEQIECCGETCDIPCNICKTFQSRTLETMLGNCISNIVDCVVWDLKLVAICVGKGSVWRSFRFLDLIQR